MSLEVLRGLVRGDVLLPGDDGFADASRAWNLGMPQQPAAVVRVADALDVAELAGAAPDLGVVLAAQPGGHGATEAINGTVLVRTAALDGIAVDADAARARVGSGVKWGGLHGHLAGTGLIGMGGSNPDVSMTGLMLGGGMSWFSRRYGMSATRFLGAEIVDGSGGPRWVDDISDPDLMWALRGGGGEFGVVTSIEVELLREPQVHGGQLVFALTDAAGVLEAYRDVTAAADDRLTCWASLTHVPDLPFLPAEIRGKSLASVVLTWLGPQDAFASELARLRAAGTLLMDSIRPVPIEQLGSVSGEPTDPLPFMDWGTTVSALEPTTCDRILDVFADREATALMSVNVRHLGGAFATPHPDRPGACDHLDGVYSVAGLSLLFSPDVVGPVQASFRQLGEAVADVNLDRVPLTFVSAGQSARRAFDEPTLDRLRTVKQRVDPHGIFRGNFPLG